MNRPFKTFAVVTFCVFMGSTASMCDKECQSDFTYGNHMANRTTNQGPASPIRETNPRQTGSALPNRGGNARLIGFILPRADGTSTLQLMPGARQLIGPGRRIGTAPLSHLRNLAAMSARNSGTNLPSGSQPASINPLNAARRPNMLRQESPASSAEPGRSQNNIFIQLPQRTDTSSSSTAQQLQSFVPNRTNFSSSGNVARSARPSGEIINMLQNTGLAGIRRRQPTVPAPRRATTLVNGMTWSEDVNNSGVRGSVGLSMNIGTLDHVARERIVASNTTETSQGNMGLDVRNKVTDIQSSVNVAQSGVSTMAVQNISGVVDSDTIRNANNRVPTFDIMQGVLGNVETGPKQVLDNQSRTQTVDKKFKSSESNQNPGLEAMRLPDGAQAAENVSGMSNMKNAKIIFTNASDILKTPHVDVRLDATSTLHGIAKATDQFANMIPVKARTDVPQFDGLDNTKNKSWKVSFDGDLNVERTVPITDHWIPAERVMASEASGAESSKVNVSTFSSIQPSKVPVINIGVSQDIASAETQTGMNNSFNNISGQSMNFVSAGSRAVAKSEFVGPGSVVSMTFMSTNNSDVTKESGQSVISTTLDPVLASILGREKSVNADHETQRANMTENAVFQNSAKAIRKRLRTEVQNMLGVISNGVNVRDMSSSTVGDHTSSVRKPSSPIHNQEVGASSGLIGLKLLEQNVNKAIDNITSGVRENPELVYTDKKTLRTVIEDALREMLSIFMNKSSTGATPSGRGPTESFNRAGVPGMKIAKEKVKKAETGFPTNTANLVYIKTGNDASLTEAEVNVTGNAASRTDVLDLKQLTGFDKRDSKKGSTTFVKETTGKEALKHSKVVDMTTVKPLVELESNHFSSNVNSSASTEKSQLVSDISKSYFATENVKPIMTTAVQRPLVSSRGVKKIIGDWDGTLKEGATPIVMFNDVNNREIHKASHHPLFMMDNHVQPFTPLTPSLPFIFPSTPAAVMNRRIEDRQQLPPPILTPATIVLKSSNSFSGEAASSVLSSSFRIQIGNTEANDTNTVSDHSNMPRTEKIIVELSSISRDMENKTASRWLDTKYNHTIEGMVSPLYKSRSFSPGKSTTPYTSSRGEHARSTDGYFSNPGSSGAPNVISYSTQNKSITYVPSLILPGPNEFSDQHAIAKNDKSQNILHLFTIPTNQRSSNTSANPIRYLTANNVPSNILISAPGEFNSNISNDNNSVIAETQSIASLNESIFMYHNISTQRENSSLQLKSENSTYLNNTETTDNTTSDNTTIDPVTLDATAQSNSTDIFDFSSSTEAMTTPEASTVSTIPTPTTPDPDALAEIRELQRVANMYISPTDPNASELKAEAAEAREALS